MCPWILNTPKSRAVTAGLNLAPRPLKAEPGLEHTVPDSQAYLLPLTEEVKDHGWMSRAQRVFAAPLHGYYRPGLPINPADTVGIGLLGGEPLRLQAGAGTPGLLLLLDSPIPLEPHYQGFCWQPGAILSYERFDLCTASKGMCVAQTLPLRRSAGLLGWGGVGCGNCHTMGHDPCTEGAFGIQIRRLWSGPLSLTPSHNGLLHHPLSGTFVCRAELPTCLERSRRAGACAGTQLPRPALTPNHTE